MNTEETRVEMKDAENGIAQPQPPVDEAGDADPPADPADPADPAPAAPDADATEADVSEGDLDQEEQEKQPMAADGVEAGAAETNGAMKLKMLDDEEEEEEEEREQVAVKFTGLSKEELLRVAGTPGWVRTRWALLLVFWLGWLGMLGGAVLILLQVPPCKELPATRWWNSGPLFQIECNQTSGDTHYLKGLEQKVDSLYKMKVKGLVVGPIHVAPPDEAMSLRLEEISPEAGNLDQFRSFTRAAHKRGISVVLDLTPNYLGSSGPWFSTVSMTNVAERLKSALVFWLEEDVDGIQLSGVEHVAALVPSLWSDIRAIIQNGTDKYPNKRVLIGVTDSSSAENVSAILSSTGVDLLISNLVSIKSILGDPVELAQAVQLLYSSHGQSQLAWNLGLQPSDLPLESRSLMRAVQLLLMTLPGTPVLRDGRGMCPMNLVSELPMKSWNSEQELNETTTEDQMSCNDFFQTVSKLRGKERSLLYGDFMFLHNSSSSLVYLRVWDQSERYLVAFNLKGKETVLQLSDKALPRQASVTLSTTSGVLPKERTVDLRDLHLGPEQAALIKFPYSG
ncbi:amino acid transporter heavy chain SLC3A2-like [Cololabis saira]|uniref:amino acid transporter heavy chain SLC3A2-like n=1 Tax=Cololabis saira TaxID=129043 RepID=UPI002AD508EB|nr:amino acid transporter heavy chain SLC3A2-like [Cololabis saira]